MKIIKLITPIISAICLLSVNAAIAQKVVDSTIIDRISTLEQQVADQKPGESHFMVVGLATLGFVSSKTTFTPLNGLPHVIKTNSLADADRFEFSPMLLWRHDRKFLVEFEPSFDGVSIGVNWANVSYFAAPGLVIHAGYFVAFGINENIPLSPSCHHYTSYLLKEASLSAVEVAMAAVLPCFWIYKQVGDFIYEYQNRSGNPYQNWIDTYAGEEFGLLVEKAIGICDEVAVTCTPMQQRLMTEAFMTSCRLEYMFWDSAWRLEKWPVEFKLI